MTETTTSTRRLDLKQLPSFLFRPRKGFEWLAEHKGAAWLTPMLVLNLTLLLSVLVTGFLRARAASMGETNLPADWQWWTPDMQQNYMQAVQATQGPVFLYVIPLVTGLAGLWLGWGILSALLHLISTLLGGRGAMSSALNIVAWAGLPFALRDLMRMVYMLIAGHTIVSPGLSGFITATEGGALFFANLLKHVDLFLLWRIILLVMGISRMNSLPRAKAIAGVILVILIALAVQGGLGALSSSLGSMMITRPFF